jgi:leucyl-tRNA synthetase
MAAKYFPKNFEKKWAERWLENKIYKTPLNSEKKKEKNYVLSMFPYPSGAGLHIGHVRIYTGTDVLARFFRMNGRAVLHPMGWDAFGLPAENAAIKAKKNPLDMVPKNIENFKRQMIVLGFSYDWEKELATTNPEYYQWTQWLFIQFFKMGLLYKKNTPINYCPKCKRDWPRRRFYLMVPMKDVVVKSSKKICPSGYLRSQNMPIVCFLILRD